MAELTVRRLLIDLEQPVARHWFGGEAFATALFNALSMSFPFGEQFFIDSVRDALAKLPREERAPLQDEVRGFIGQEATHRRIHALFNAHLERQGLVDAWSPRAQARLVPLAGNDARHALGITAANEHFTAVFADWMLRNPEVFRGLEPRLLAMWMWHSAEELEHRATALRVYRALGGNEEWRRTWFKRISWVFLGDLMRQTAANLRADGTLWHPSTWVGAMRFLFGRQGMVRLCLRPWLTYLDEGFDPARTSDEPSRRWLADNQGRYTAVGVPAPAAA